MSPLRIETLGEENITKITTLSDGAMFLKGGVSVRVFGNRNEVVVPHIMDIHFKSNSYVEVRPFDGVSNLIFLRRGEMELESKIYKIGIAVVDNLDIRKK